MDDEQLDILAWTMLGEAGGTGVQGMADVGNVVLNRLETGRWGSTIKDVAQANKQFSTWNSGAGGNDPQGTYPKSSPAFQRARQLAEQVAAGQIQGPPGKPLDYHATNISPYWADSKNKYGAIVRNGHTFYPSTPVPPGEIPNTVGTRTDTIAARQAPAPVTPSPDMSLMRKAAPPSSLIADSFSRISQSKNQSGLSGLDLSLSGRPNAVTPRLTPEGDNAYTYWLPDATPTSLTGGMGSLTPSIGQIPKPATMSAHLSAQRATDPALASALAARYPVNRLPEISIPRLPPPAVPPRRPDGDAALHPFDAATNTPRPNADGSFSTEITRTVQLPDGNAVNVPSLWWGQGQNVRDFGSMSDDQLADFAMRYEQQSGNAFPRYGGIPEAERAAMARSNDGGGTQGPMTYPGSLVAQSFAQLPKPPTANPALQAALDARIADSNRAPTPTPMPTSIAGARLINATFGIPQNGIGQPPATRTVQSVPMPAVTQTSEASPYSYMFGRPQAVPSSNGTGLSRDSVQQAQSGNYMTQVLPNIPRQVMPPPVQVAGLPNAIPGPAPAFKTADALNPSGALFAAGEPVSGFGSGAVAPIPMPANMRPKLQPPVPFDRPNFGMGGPVVNQPSIGGGFAPQPAPRSLRPPTPMPRLERPGLSIGPFQVGGPIGAITRAMANSSGPFNNGGDNLLYNVMRGGDFNTPGAATHQSASGYLFAPKQGGGFTNVGRANPQMSPAMTYAMANARDSRGNTQGGFASEGKSDYFREVTGR